MRLSRTGDAGLDGAGSQGLGPNIRVGRILTLNAKNSHSLWREKTTLLPGYGEYFAKTGWRPFWETGALDAYWAWRLFRESRHFDAVFTTNERCSWIFALLQLVRGRHRVPHFQLEFIWNPPTRRWLRFLKVTAFRLQQRAVDGIVTFSEEQARRYSAYFPFAADKFRVIRFHTTLYKTPVEPSAGSYIFSGGDTCRDYRTLVEAVRGSNWDAVIATVRRDQFDGTDLPSNVRVVTTGREEFLGLMAGAAVVVVPLRKDLLHVGGHQTYLNAMALGKPVVVADDGGAREYIRDEVDGFIVAAGDVVALRRCLAGLMGSEALRASVGSQAKEQAKMYGPERFFRAALLMVEKRLRRDETSATVSF